jgi:hypothetical protein
MYKKLLMACMAVAAFAAFVIAPAASASPVLTSPVGTALATGSTIKGTNEGITKFTAGELTVECSSAVLTGTLLKNNGTEIEGTVLGTNAVFTGTGTSGDCTSKLGSTKPTVNGELCLKNVKGADTLTVNGCGTNPVDFSLNVTGVVTCRYTAASVTGTYETNKDAKVVVFEQPATRKEGGFLCPETGKLDMTFNLTTGAGATILVS